MRSRRARQPASAAQDGIEVVDTPRVKLVSQAIIGKSLGHKNVATTAIYARLQTDPVRASMTKATEAMFQGVDMTAFTKLPVPR